MADPTVLHSPKPRVSELQVPEENQISPISVQAEGSILEIPRAGGSRHLLLQQGSQ